jgi:hypothetical protein
MKGQEWRGRFANVDRNGQDAPGRASSDSMLQEGAELEKGGFACEQVAPKRDWYEQEFLIRTALDRIFQGQD